MDKHEYFKHPGISNSGLGNFKRSPAHYQYFKLYPTPDTQATLIGSAFHYMVFEPGNFSKYMMVLNEHERPEPSKDYRTVVNKVWKDEQLALAKSKGLEIISSDDYGKAQDMYDSLMKDSQAAELVKSKKNKFEKFDTWEWDGMLFKRKADIWHPDFLADLKSCENADPVAFEKSIFSWDYHRQGGMYSDGDRILEDTEFFKDFYLIAVEKSEPYGVSVHLLSEEVLQYGCDEYRKLAQDLRKCEQENKWPGYDYKTGGINNIYLPKYLKND